MTANKCKNCGHELTKKLNSSRIRLHKDISAKYRGMPTATTQCGCGCTRPEPEAVQ